MDGLLYFGSDRPVFGFQAKYFSRKNEGKSAISGVSNTLGLGNENFIISKFSYYHFLSWFTSVFPGKFRFGKLKPIDFCEFS